MTPLPYSFAKRHGLIAQLDEQHKLSVLHRAGLSPAALAEARRVLGQPFELRLLSDDAFEQLLAGLKARPGTWFETPGGIVANLT